MQSRSCLKGLQPSELLRGIVSHITGVCPIYFHLQIKLLKLQSLLVAVQLFKFGGWGEGLSCVL